MFMLLLLLLACQRPGVSPYTSDTQDTSLFEPGDSFAPADSSDSAFFPDTSGTGSPDSGHSGDTGGLDYDCDDLPTTELEDNILDWARGYHDVVFRDDGFLIGLQTGTGLIESTYDELSELWIPDVNGIETMDRFEDGSFVMSDNSQSRLILVTPDGAISTLASNVGMAKGVTVGPDGNVYYANGAVYRYNVVTEETDKLMDAVGNSRPRHLVFSLDSTRLFVATLGRGEVYVLNMDEDLNPVGDPELYAENVGTGWHDGIAIDACGNLYVPEYYSMGLYRITPHQVVERLGPSGTGERYGHGLEFGSGEYGWKAMALYMPLPYNNQQVRELVIMAPSGSRVRTWNGEPAR